MSTPPSDKISLAASSTVYTYHCLCTHLVLATTTPLPALPTRKHGIDKAHIMPLPPPPPPPPSSPLPSSPPPRSTAAAHAPAPIDHYGLLLSTTLDRTAEMIRSDQGFEKRYLHRCGRCRLIIGYQLDWQQFEADRAGRRDDLVFLLPGGFVTTSDMIRGKAVDAAIGFVGVAEVAS